MNRPSQALDHTALWRLSRFLPGWVQDDAQKRLMAYSMLLLGGGEDDNEDKVKIHGKYHPQVVSYSFVHHMSLKIHFHIVLRVIRTNAVRMFWHFFFFFYFFFFFFGTERVIEIHGPCQLNLSVGQSTKSKHVGWTSEVFNSWCSQRYHKSTPKWCGSVHARGGSTLEKEATTRSRRGFVRGQSFKPEPLKNPALTSQANFSLNQLFLCKFFRSF